MLANSIVVKPSEVVRPSGAQTLPHAPVFDLEALVKATPDTPLGIWRYGFLEDVPDWQIASVPLGPKQIDTLKAMLKANPSLAWLKDDKCVALFVPGMDVAAFLQLGRHPSQYAQRHGASVQAPQPYSAPTSPVPQHDDGSSPLQVCAPWFGADAVAGWRSLGQPPLSQTHGQRAHRERVRTLPARS